MTIAWQLIDSLKKSQTHIYQKVAELNTYLSLSKTMVLPDLSEVEYFATKYFWIGGTGLIPIIIICLGYSKALAVGCKCWANIGFFPAESPATLYLINCSIKYQQIQGLTCWHWEALFQERRKRSPPLLSVYIKKYMGKYAESEPESCLAN